jgi:hypothetical protein
MDVPSIDTALQTIERLGGSTVVPKQPVRGRPVGDRAVLTPHDQVS